MEPAKRNPKPGAEGKSKFLRMKLRARWYFKKEDMAGIGGTYVGVKSRKALLETLGPRDLILGRRRRRPNMVWESARGFFF